MRVVAGLWAGLLPNKKSRAAHRMNFLEKADISRRNLFSDMTGY
jgi:hypothetical protein